MGKKSNKAFIQLVCKVSCFIFCLIFLSSCRHIEKLNEEDYQKDCSYLRKLLTECSIDVSKSIDEGLNLDKVFEDIDKNYRKYKNRVNGSEAFAWAISKSLVENVPRKNSHNYIKSDQRYYGTVICYVPFFSSIYLEKNGDTYTVYHSDEKRIAPGMIYTGDELSLFKTIYDDRVLYRFGVFTDGYIRKISISLNEKDYVIPVKMPQNTVDTEAGNISYVKKDSNLFLQLNSCMWHTEAEKNQYEDTFKEIGQLLLTEDIQNIIIDLRANTGGYNSVVYWALYYLIYGKSENLLWEEYESYVNYLDSGGVCINTEMMRNAIGLEGRSEDVGRFLLQNVDKRYVPINEDVEMPEKPVPVYKGKIVLLTSYGTGSAAENLVLQIKEVFEDKVVVAGINSSGSLDYPDVHNFFLPASKIAINLSKTDKTSSNLLKNNHNWHGDGRGVYPDFWQCFDEDANVSDMLYNFFE